jgi:aspartate aminotransferase-like enzyme
MLTNGTFFLPGPTEVRPEILQQMARPMMPHRSATFERIYEQCDHGMRSIFRTTRPVYLGTSSATGMMEAGIRSAPPGTVLSLVMGAFSERFAHVAGSCGRTVVRDDVAHGMHHTPERVYALVQASGAAAVTVAQSETSTGAFNDIEAIARAVHAAGAVILVDSVTGCGGAQLEADAWKLDFVFTGSQKALALPPGLALAVASQSFIDAAASNADRGAYFDLVEIDAYAAKNQTPQTPVISLFYALAAQVDAIANEGLEQRWVRHLAMQSITIEWVQAMTRELDPALTVLAASDGRSPTVTCIALPASLTGPGVAAGVAEQGYMIGSGYGALRDRTIRVGHMGDHTPEGLTKFLSVVREVIATQLGR